MDRIESLVWYDSLVSEPRVLYQIGGLISDRESSSGSKDLLENVFQVYEEDPVSNHSKTTITITAVSNITVQRQFLVGVALGS